MIEIYDRIKEYSYVLGTGNVTLQGVVKGFSTFSSAYNNNDRLFYAITDGNYYEIGSGIYLSGIPNQIVRFPLKSSNNNNRVNFGEGVKEVYSTYPATHAIIHSSGINNAIVPDSSGIAFWSSNNSLDYDNNIIWNKTSSRLGLLTRHPQYTLDIGGDGSQSIIRSSGIVVGSSGIYFPPLNNGDFSYSGGRQLSHFEQNRLDDYAVNNGFLGNLTGSSAVLQLSGIVNNYILFKKQNAGFVFAGPPSGCVSPCSPSYPSFRPLSCADLLNFETSVSGLFPRINNSGINKVLTSDGTPTGSKANSTLYLSGPSSNILNITSTTGVSATLRIGGEGLSSITDTANASFFSKGSLIIMREDTSFVTINSSNRHSTFNDNVSFVLDSGKIVFDTSSDGPILHVLPATGINTGTSSRRVIAYGSLQLGQSAAPYPNQGYKLFSIDPIEEYDNVTENLEMFGAVTQGIWRGRPIEVDNGGTGKTSYSNGQLLIGSGSSLATNTLTAGDNISITNGSGTITISASNAIVDSLSEPRGRLSLESGVSVSTNNQINKNILYYVPYDGDRISVFSQNGSKKIISFENTFISLSAISSGSIYDVFGYDNNNNLALELSTAWTNQSTRSVALSGVGNNLYKSGDISRRYLGTIRASDNGVCEDSEQKRFLWNFYNRVDKKVSKTLVNAWTYSSSSWRHVGNVKSSIEIVNGLSDRAIDIEGDVLFTSDFPNAILRYSIGFAIDSVFPSGSKTTSSYADIDVYSVDYRIIDYPKLGYSSYNLVEKGTDGQQAIIFSIYDGINSGKIEGKWWC